MNNTVYWMALIYVLREPLGVIMVVLAFLLASFFIDPFQRIVGLPPENALDPGAVVAAIIGTLLCLAEVTVPAGNLLLTGVWWGQCCSAPGEAWTALLAAVTSTCPPSTEYASLTSPAPLTPPSSPPPEAHTAAVLPSNGALAPMGMDGSPVHGSAPKSPAWRHTAAVAAAFAILALTAGIGIVVTTYFEQRAGLNMFGYAAVDQVLLPFTSLPVAWLLYQFPAALAGIGEPQGDIQASKGGDDTPPRTFWGVLVLTWEETRWGTLVPFRGLMFAREFVFFYLATAFPDVNAVYLQMTLVRVVLCWLAALLACTYLRGWVGVTPGEAATTMHPVNLGLKALGSLTVVLAILRLTGHL